MPLIWTKRFLSIAAACVALCTGSLAEAQARTSPVGLWNTISDDDGQATAVVEIKESPTGEFVGIVRGILLPATHDDSVCGRCSDDRRGQPIVGMEILRHMRRQDDEWAGGEILDPENGKTYRAKMKLQDDGNTLIVRGYIGFSLIGRSQTWRRRP